MMDHSPRRAPEKKNLSTPHHFISYLALMELWTLLFLLLFLPIFISYLLKSLVPSKTKKAPLPPGPPYIPILTTLSWLRRPIFDLESLLRRLRSIHGPILTLHITSRPSIFISDRRLAHKALVQLGPTFADRPSASPSDRIITSNNHNISSAAYGPLWRLLRRNLAAEMLHPSRVKLFGPARDWVANILFNNLIAQSKTGDGVVVVMEGFQFASFCLLVLMCFGEKLDEREIRQIERAQRALLSNFLKFNIFNIFPRITKLVFRKLWNQLLEIRKDQEDLFLPLIRGRREGKGERGRDGSSFVYCYVDSLLQLRLPAEEGGRQLTEDEIVSLCSEFLSAGTDTTATVIQWIMAELVKNERIQRKLLEEIEQVVGTGEVGEEDLQRMPYLKAVVLEGLRRHPPGHFVLPHTVTEEVEIEGYVLPKNAMVNFAVAEIGWDENVWMEPAEFRPERFLDGGEGQGVDLTGTREIKMMPFGAGRRICPGLGLALLHLEYFVANLVREFEWKEVEGEEVDLAERLDFTVVMKNPLRARISTRRNKQLE